MLKAERHDTLISLLRSREFASVGELSGLLQVSAATLRRDLIDLEEQHRVERIWGGARLRAEHDDPFQVALTRNGDAKRRIGQAAAELVEREATVILDIGTTVHHLALALSEKNITVLTASLPAFEVLRESGKARMILLGGHWSEQYRCFTGIPVLDALFSQQADVAFLGCSGISRSGRIRDTSQTQGSIKRAIRQASTQVYLLADAHKFPGRGSDSPLTVGDVDGIITDAAELPAELAKECESQGTRIRQI